MTGRPRWAITAHDVRREPALEWARNCVERILRDGAAPEPQTAVDKPEFGRAVVESLQSFMTQGTGAESAVAVVDAALSQRHA
ncbi:MAG: hypothetical protein U5R46_01465 [Gammaproteobacteria bacterium]|nr:hypothetical protein [Gammaproteobacteria bacterium]